MTRTVSYTGSYIMIREDDDRRVVQRLAETVGDLKELVRELVGITQVDYLDVIVKPTEEGAKRELHTRKLTRSWESDARDFAFMQGERHLKFTYYSCACDEDFAYPERAIVVEVTPDEVTMAAP